MRSVASLSDIVPTGTGKVRGVGCLAAALSVATLTMTPGATQEEGVMARLPAFVIDGEIHHDDRRWRASDFTAQLGGVNFGGALSVDLSGQGVAIEGALHAPHFDYRALRRLLEETGLVAAGTDDGDGLLPSFDLPTACLDQVTIDLDLELSAIQGLGGVVSAITTHVSALDRRLAFKPLEVVVANGTITGESALNARRETSTADLVIDVAKIDLDPLLEGSRLAGSLSGLISGNLQLLGRGDSLKRVLATADGEASIRMEEGSVGGLLLELVGVDVVEALALYIGDSDRVPINCGRIDLVVSDGMAELTRLLVDTGDSVLVGGGTIDLGSEALDLHIEARAKDFSLIDASAPILIEGTLIAPSYSIGDMEGLPFFNMGEAEAVNCDWLLDAEPRRPQVE